MSLSIIETNTSKIHIKNKSHIHYKYHRCLPICFPACWSKYYIPTYNMSEVDSSKTHIKDKDKLNTVISEKELKSKFYIKEK